MNWEATIADWKYDSEHKIVYGPHYAYAFVDLRYLGYDYGYWYMIGPY